MAREIIVDIKIVVSAIKTLDLMKRNAWNRAISGKPRVVPLMNELEVEEPGL